MEIVNLYYNLRCIFMCLIEISVAAYVILVLLGQEYPQNEHVMYIVNKKDICIYISYCGQFCCS
jgi:hypothetical protein